MVKTIYRGAPGRKVVRRLFGVRKSEHGQGRCLECGFEVALRSDGSLRAHRVGTTYSNSWPCRGARATDGT